jgi:hypothetical protein
MPIPVVCSCSAKLKVGDHLQGKHVKCPKCGALLPVGIANGAVPAAPAPPKPPPTTQTVLEQSPLSDREREVLDEELGPGERLVWAGKADATATFRRGLIVTASTGGGAVFALVMLLLLLFGAPREFRSGFGGIIGLVFGAIILILVGIAAAAPYLNRWRMEKIVYAITTKRALVWNSNWVGKLTLSTYGPADMGGLSLRGVWGGGEGVGNLIFFSRAKNRKVDLQSGVRSLTHYGFLLVPRAAEVEKILRETLLDPYMDKLYE